MGAGSSRLRSGGSPRAGAPLRADAARNRQRILDAARAAFAEHGIEVPMAAVARRAGVGPATLYRRFPTRDDLVREVFADQLAACTAALDEALDDPDPWRGLRHVIGKVCALQAAERGFTGAFLRAFPGAQEGHARSRRRGEHGLATLVRRAQESGALRRDFHPSDLTVLLLANGGLVAALSGTDDGSGPDDGSAAEAASRRLVAYLLDSFRADRADGTGGAKGTEGADGTGRTPLPPPTGLGLDRLAPGGS
ncbi:TetR/AcrR family transcriptional regulator [Streptomyces sp. ODS28]|uniref:TetR/AcrR family transcriptional regulator n=1 Tax=Streptomyces sp. ODS28 TaxID=3136688 RepID=UPI0031E99A0E